MDDSKVPTHLSARKGEEFNLELVSYPGSGAMWRYVPTEDVQLVDERIKPQDESIGSASLQIFTLRADRSGPYNLVFELKRAWEHIPRARKEIRVDVE